MIDKKGKKLLEEELNFLEETSFLQDSAGTYSPLGLILGMFILGVVGLQVLSSVCLFGVLIFTIAKVVKKRQLRKLIKAYEVQDE